jgi:hypothetical protein
MIPGLFVSYLRRHHIGLLALGLVLTGTAYAAATLPKNSVGTRQLKNGAVSAKKIKSNAVSSSKVKNRSLLAKDFKPGQLPKGPKGDAGASALNPVPSGKTIRGVVGGDFHAYDATARVFAVDVTLPIPAANALGDDAVFVNVAGWQNAGGQNALGNDAVFVNVSGWQNDGVGQTPPTTSDTDPGCTGTPANPTAPPGKVCIYVSIADNAFNVRGGSVLGGAGASPYGFQLKWDSTLDGDTLVDATWAYTAP